MGFELKADDPDAINLSNILMLPKGSQDVDGTALMWLPGNWLRIDISALAAANDIVGVLNPFGLDVIITEKVIRVKTAGGTATAVIDVDVVDLATDTGDDIFDGVDANAAAVIHDKAAGAGTNAEHTAHLWGKSGTNPDHVSAKLLVEAAASLVAYVYLHCLPTE